jgi:hypothetical protein
VGAEESAYGILAWLFQLESQAIVHDVGNYCGIGERGKNDAVPRLRVSLVVSLNKNQFNTKTCYVIYIS